MLKASIPANPSTHNPITDIAKEMARQNARSVDQGAEIALNLIKDGIKKLPKDAEVSDVTKIVDGYLNIIKDRLTN